MDTSRTPTSADEEQNSRMNTLPHVNQAAYAYQESGYHQKPPSFIHKQVNISLVDDGSSQQKKTKSKSNSKTEKQQQASGEWRESIPIKLEHLLFNFKENSLKVYKSSPPRIMQLIALIAALLLFCGVLALVLSQREDNLKKEANLPSDQSAIAERIVGESLLGSHKLKNSLFEPKNQTAANSTDKSKKYTKEAKDAAVRKAFGSLLNLSGDDNDEVEPDPEEISSDESFDGERSKNFNLFLSDNERPEEKTSENENPKVMFIERLMGLHFGLQPKIGVSESLVIRKTLGGDENAIEDQASKDSEVDLFNGMNVKEKANSRPSANKGKDSKSEVPTPFLLRYAAAAMLSRVLAAAQQQAYIQQLQQQRYREMSERFSSPYRGYRMMREPEPAASYMREPAAMSSMYGRPMHKHHHHQTRPFQQPPFVSERGYSRGPLITNEEAESQQMHPIILMFMGQSQAQPSFAHPAMEQPVLMPYAATPRQNPYMKFASGHPVERSPPRESAVSAPPPAGFNSRFAHHPKSHSNYYPQPSNPHHHASSNEAVYYAPHQYMQPPMRSQAARYNPHITNTIEVPIEIHTPSVSSANQAQTQIIVQPEIHPQPNESNDQSGENEQHMVVFYSDADNINHPEEPNANSVNNAQPQMVEKPVFIKENKPIINNDAEKANQITKMLLLHFVNPNDPNAQNVPNQQLPLENSQAEQLPPTQQQPPPQQMPQQPPQNIMMKPFLMNQQDQPEKNSKLGGEEMIVPAKPVMMMNQNKPPNKQPQEMMIKNEESNDPEVNRDENEQASNPNESEADSTNNSLAQFAQVIRHQLQVIDQQNRDQQRQAQSAAPSTMAQPTIQPQPMQSSNFQLPVRKEIQIENSNKEPETKPQESVVQPAFMIVPDNDEN